MLVTQGKKDKKKKKKGRRGKEERKKGKKKGKEEEEKKKKRKRRRKRGKEEEREEEKEERDYRSVETQYNTNLLQVSIITSILCQVWTVYIATLACASKHFFISSK